MQSAVGTTIVLAGRVIDGTQGDVRNDVAITVRDGLITAIEDRAEADSSAAAEVVDLSQETVLPGLIDAHMHFFGVPSHQLQRLPKETESYRALRAAGE